MNRWRRILGGFALAGICLPLAGCSPFNQGAVSLDGQSRLPKLVLTYCDGEAIESVRLVEVVDKDYTYEEVRTRWRIEADKPRAVGSVVVGEVPDGFREVVPFDGDLQGPFVLSAVTHGGVAAQQSSGRFSVPDLESGVLRQGGEVVTASELRRDADKNCSTSIFGSLGLPTWLDAVAYVTFVGVAAAAIALYVVHRRRPRPSSTRRSGTPSRGCLPE